MWKRGTALFTGPCGARGPKRQPQENKAVHAGAQCTLMESGCEGAEPTGVSGGGFQEVTAGGWNQPDWECVPHWEWLRGSINYLRSGYFKDPEESWWAFSIAALEVEEMKQLSGPTSWKTFLLWDYWSVTKADAGRYHSTAPAAKPRRAWDRGRCWWLLRASLLFLGVYLSLSLSLLFIAFIIIDFIQIINLFLSESMGFLFLPPSSPSLHGRAELWVSGSVIFSCHLGLNHDTCFMIVVQYFCVIFL